VLNYEVTKKGKGAGTPKYQFSASNKNFEPWLGDAEGAVPLKEKEK